MTKRLHSITAAAMLALSVVGLSTAADARRGGSMGSRGSHTYSAPRATYGNGGVGAVQRSATPQSYGSGYGGYGGGYGSRGYGQNNYQGYGQNRPFQSPSRPRFGFGTGLVGGLVAGGLLGSLLGHGGGWGAGGGGAGMLGGLLQLLVIGGLIWFAISFFRRRGTGTGGFRDDANYTMSPPPAWAKGTTTPIAPQQKSGPMESQIEITPADRSAFERVLTDVQAAYSREDQSRLRSLATGEMVGYFAEEFEQNKANGVRNDVSAVHLLDAEVSEAWSENGVDYATVSLRYESIDVMRDRTTGAIAQGDATASQTIEYWTFRRDATGAWKVSAIQEA